MVEMLISLVEEALQPLPISVVEKENSIHVDLSALGEGTWLWKRQTLKEPDPAKILDSLLKRYEGRWDAFVLSFKAPEKMSEVQKITKILETYKELMLGENLQKDVWAKAVVKEPTGFDETKLEEDLQESTRKLDELYQDDFVVREKKPLIMDLYRSTGAYMVSPGKNPKSLIDGASQIASLAVGFNDSSTLPMTLRREALFHGLSTPDGGTEDYERWDVSKAFFNLMKKESGLPYLSVVNSGAEAIETGIRACQTKYPDRRKVVAFEGSFHGRTLLSLNLTFNPAKRKGFELEKAQVEFSSFPEMKTSELHQGEPEEWVRVWSDPKSKESMALREKWRKVEDKLFQRELKALDDLESRIEKKDVLSVLIEPIQCEGGDRYASSRFFRALRLLTRAYDTPLVMDEVQAGFGLGGKLFWHKMFCLQDPTGESDTPDALCLAKKSQVAFCLSRFDQNIPIENTRASFLRGYIQAQQVMLCDFKPIEEKVGAFLKSLQKTLGEDLIQSPRYKGLAFAFDLPDNELLKKLISKRFASGILFYPAGQVTARFRLLVTVTDQELYQVFHGIYRCFEHLSKGGEIKEVPSFEDFVKAWPEKLHPCAKAQEAIESLDLKEQTPWGGFPFPETKEAFCEVDTGQWDELFKNLLRAHPMLLYRSWNFHPFFKKLEELSADRIWDFYQKEARFTAFDLLWMGSRALGSMVQRFSKSEVSERAEEIIDLEKSVYEPQRQDEPALFEKIADHKHGIVMGHLHEGKLKAICAAAPLKLFDYQPLVKDDPEFENDRVIYSADLSVHPDLQGKGLGLRLKAEQFMSAVSDDVLALRSRNRYPEAKKMFRMNQLFSSVVLGENPSAYGGDGKALYQSIRIHKPMPEEEVPIFSSAYPGLRNKLTLSNFISNSYVHHLQFMKALLPEAFRHLYLASGRAEAVDKAVKLFMAKRPEATDVLSYDGDYFGATTATARSLGRQDDTSYFDWPLLAMPDFEALKDLSEKDWQERIEESFRELRMDQILGLMVEPLCEKACIRKPKNYLKALIKVCRSKKLPVIFHESASAFFNYSANRFFCAGDEIKPDGIVFYLGEQVAFLACQEELFLKKPLTMISTWDGDDHSMRLLRDKIFKAFEEKDL